MSVKVGKAQNNANAKNIQHRSKSEPVGKVEIGNVNDQSTEIVNIRNNNNNAILRNGTNEQLTGRMSMKNKDEDIDDMKEYSPPAKPIIHPKNEKELSSLPLLSNEYQTCHKFIFGMMREIIGTHIIILRRIKYTTLEFIARIIENYSYKNLIVSSKETKLLYPNTEFIYNYVIIESDGILTSRNQGIIGIKCFDLILKERAILHMNGKGYQGGLPERQGGSYTGNNGVFTASKEPNYGGGGGGILFGGGGGYGTKGQNADYRYVYKSGDGGLTYGDTRELDYENNFNHFYMGSGGGGGYNDGHKKINTLHDKTRKIGGGNLNINNGITNDKNIQLANISRGGDGGGGLYLNIIGSLHLSEKGMIQCNGQDGYQGVDCGGGGGGSGGTILIHLNDTFNLIMEFDSHIQAIGGCGAIKNCGKGGYGRIRIKFTNGDHNIRLPKNIRPRPYIG